MCVRVCVTEVEMSISPELTRKLNKLDEDDVSVCVCVCARAFGVGGRLCPVFGF